MKPAGPRNPGRILFEFIELGGQVRVAAIDERTGVEVVAVAPAGSTRQQMQQLAAAKLRRRLAQQASQ
jgi:hypothetical protein